MTASRPMEHGGSAAAWLAGPRDAPDLAGLVVRAVAAAAATAAAGSGVVIAARRLAGAVEPAGAAPLVAVTAAGIAVVRAVDATRRVGGGSVAPIAARCGLVVAVAALVLPVPAARWPWVAVAVAATAAALVRFPARLRGDAPIRERMPTLAPTDRRPRPRARRRASSHGRNDGLLRQRYERRELPAGTERIRGRVLVPVPAGSKTGYGHLGFCPALVATPTVELTTPDDGVEATVTAAEVLPWGVRVECRLAEPADEPLEIPVDLVAHAPAATP